MAGERTCKTCKWWGNVKWDYEKTYEAYEYVWLDPTTFYTRETELPVLQKPCGSPKLVDASDLRDKQMAALPSDVACYQDYEGYQASFWPGPDFGCIHHEEVS